MIVVGFHGGSDGNGAGAVSEGYNNLVAYDDDGRNPVCPILVGDKIPLPPMSELRGIGIVPTGYLWVVSGGQDTSAILL